MPGRKCTVCSHPRRSEIDAMLAEGCRHAAVAARFQISPDALSRHARAHIQAGTRATEAPAAIGQPSGFGQPRDLLATLMDTQATLVRVVSRAERSKQGTILISACRELRQTIEAIGRLTGAIEANGMLAGQHRHGDAVGDQAARERLLQKAMALRGATPPD